MTDWNTCPAVERVPGRVSGGLGLFGHTDSTVRALREPCRRRDDRRVRRVVSGRR